MALNLLKESKTITFWHFHRVGLFWAYNDLKKKFRIKSLFIYIKIFFFHFTLNITVIIIPPPQEEVYCDREGLFVCLSVSAIIQKVFNGFQRNLQDRCGFWIGRTCKKIKILPPPPPKKLIKPPMKKSKLSDLDEIFRADVFRV